jgi:uncharacterized membrane protein
MAIDERTEDDLRARAVTRLKKKRDFKAHVLAYVLVNTMLVVIWALTDDGGFFWPIFPLMGWGIGVVFNAWDAYGRDANEEEIAREMARIRNRT